jgi:hypothetical protein
VTFSDASRQLRAALHLVRLVKLKRLARHRVN